MEAVKIKEKKSHKKIYNCNSIIDDEIVQKNTSSDAPIEYKLHLPSNVSLEFKGSDKFKISKIAHIDKNIPKLEFNSISKLEFSSDLFEASNIHDTPKSILFDNINYIHLKEKSLYHIDSLETIIFKNCKNIKLEKSVFENNYFRTFELHDSYIDSVIPESAFHFSQFLTNISLNIFPNSRGLIEFKKEAFGMCGGGRLGYLQNLTINVYDNENITLNTVYIIFEQRLFQATTYRKPLTIDFNSHSKNIKKLVCVWKDSCIFGTKDENESCSSPITLKISGNFENGSVVVYGDQHYMPKNSIVFGTNFNEAKSSAIICKEKNVEFRRYKNIYFIDNKKNEIQNRISTLEKEQNSILYLIYGLSGEMKEILYRFLEEFYPTKHPIEKYDCALNIKATNRNIQPYDKNYIDYVENVYFDELTGKIIGIKSQEYLDDEYSFRYHVVNEQGQKHTFILNGTQIRKAISKKRDHFIIVNDVDIIKKLQDCLKNEKVTICLIKLTYEIEDILKSFSSLEDAYRRERLNQILNSNVYIKDSNVQTITLSGKSKDEIQKSFSDQMLNIINDKSSRFDWRRLLCEKKLFDSKKLTDEKYLSYKASFIDDYDSISSLASFRRLQDKCQVFPLKRHDYPRTRLTHSIEVATTAELIGEEIVSILRGDNMLDISGKQNMRYNDYFLECRNIPIILRNASLLHDLGNPPFGHFGEETVRLWFSSKMSEQDIESYFKRYLKRIKMPTNNDYSDILKDNAKDLSRALKDFKYFEGNAQMIRLVTTLAPKNQQDNILDLTYATIATSLKYPHTAAEIPDGNMGGDPSYHQEKQVVFWGKNGYFETEKEEVEKIQTYLGLKIKDKKIRHPLVHLLEAADDISYLSHDLEDALKKDLMDINTVKNALDKLATENVSGNEEQVAVLNEVISFIKENKLHENSSADNFKILKNKIKYEMIQAVVEFFIDNYNEIMLRDNKFQKEILKESKAALVAKAIKNLLWENVYHSKELVVNELKAAGIINCLVEKFVLSALHFTFEESIYTPTGSILLKPSDTNQYNIWLSMSEDYRNKWKEKDAEIDKKIIAVKEKLNSKIYQNSTDDDKDRLYRELRSYLYDKLVNSIHLALDHFCGMTDSYAMEMYQIFKAI